LPGRNRVGRVLKSAGRRGCRIAKRESLPPARALRILAWAIALPQRHAAPWHWPCRWCRLHRSLWPRGARAGETRVAFPPPKGAIPFPGSGRVSRQAGGRIAVSAPCPGRFSGHGQAARPRGGQDGAFAVDSAAPADKRRASRISPGAAVPGLLEKRPWRNRRPSRSV